MTGGLDDNGQYTAVANLDPAIGPGAEPRDTWEPGGSATNTQCLSCGRRPGNGCRVLACRGTTAERAEWAELAEVLYAVPGSWMAQQGRTGRTWALGLYRDHEGVIVHPERGAA